MVKRLLEIMYINIIENIDKIGHLIRKLPQSTTEIIFKRYFQFSNKKWLSNDRWFYIEKYLLTNFQKGMEIRFLEIRDCRELTDKHLESIGRHLNLLERIELSYCDNITNNSLAYLLEKQKRVQFLELDNLTNVDQRIFLKFHSENTLKSLKIFNINLNSNYMKIFKEFLKRHSNTITELSLNIQTELIRNIIPYISNRIVRYNILDLINFLF